MAAPQREFRCGPVEIYKEETLGIGSYGKVCKAKCGQLLCAAKLLHDTMFGTSHQGTSKFVEQFEQECRFLWMIKHPNIVQFLGTVRDPQSQRLALLMEVMDESLTRFLERSTGPLLYHTQLNICHDVALALAYLHSNDITHRDLSSNNVLLIGEGSRAKVTDFGMSKLIGINPHTTPLTMCPGTQEYMPPEALVTPPQYSNKLDCFSHGVLAIQIVTRQAPKPTGPTSTVDDVRYPTGRVVIFVPESERRRGDINLVDPNHPLLPLALHCLTERESERPSADELCGRLATLKREQMYTRSVEQSREQGVSVQTLQQQIQEKDGELVRARANHEDQIQEKEAELERARANFLQQIQDKEAELERTRIDHQQRVKEKKAELERARADHKTELHKHQDTFQQQIHEKEGELVVIHRQKVWEKEEELEKQRDNYASEITKLHSVIEQLRHENSRLRQGQEQQKDGASQVMKQVANLTFRQGTTVPEDNMSSVSGAAVVHDSTAYFSKSDSVYFYTLDNDRWSKLAQCVYSEFSMAVVNNKVTTIGGYRKPSATNSLLCLTGGGSWGELLPPMPTARVRPATVATTTHLIVVGGRTGDGASSDTEILNMSTLQWSSASSSHQIASRCPHMSLCDGQLYLSENNTIFSCSVEELVESCSTNNSEGGSVWRRLADIPARYNSSLATFREQILAVGGSEQPSCGTPTRAIHCYDRSNNSWHIIGEMPAPRSRTLVAVLPSDELIIVGGYDGKYMSYNITLITNMDN